MPFFLLFICAFPGEELPRSGLLLGRPVAMRLFAAATALCGLLSSSILCAADDKLTTAPSSSPRLVLPRDFKPPQVFKNVNLLRNTNLEKGYVRETINVVVENVDTQPQSDYYLPFPTENVSKVGGLEVRDKKAPEKGRFAVEAAVFESARLVLSALNCC